MIQALVWGEGEHPSPEAQALYPGGIHLAVKDALNESPQITARATDLHAPQQGLSEAALEETDVLVWWGHRLHSAVEDEAVERIRLRIWQGMGFIALHSAHMSKVFRSLMGTSCTLKWRVAAEPEQLWVCQPGHPIAAGLGASITLPEEEMYGEPFDIPVPEEQIFISRFAGGEVHRSGCTWRRGNGKIFYFRPGHETYRAYYHPEIRQVLRNAVLWARPEGARWKAANDHQPLNNGG